MKTIFSTIVFLVIFSNSPAQPTSTMQLPEEGGAAQKSLNRIATMKFYVTQEKPPNNPRPYLLPRKIENRQQHHGNKGPGTFAVTGHIVCQKGKDKIVEEPGIRPFLYDTPDVRE